MARKLKHLYELQILTHKWNYLKMHNNCIICAKMCYVGVMHWNTRWLTVKRRISFCRCGVDGCTSAFVNVNVYVTYAYEIGSLLDTDNWTSNSYSQMVWDDLMHIWNFRGKRVLVFSFCSLFLQSVKRNVECVMHVKQFHSNSVPRELYQNTFDCIAFLCFYFSSS